MARRKPLIFISHDSRDADLASAFSDLIDNTSLGLIKTFRSSDNEGESGIPLTVEWYDEIRKKLTASTDVVCLLTQRSLQRPWIWYEAGVARGRNVPVYGVCLGVTVEEATSGPFNAIHVCDGTEASLSKMMKQIINRIPNTNPKTSVIRTAVKEFRADVNEFINVQRDSTEPSQRDLLLDIKRQIESTLKVDTHYVDHFPHFFDENVIDCLQNARRRITVACDFPAYGCFSSDDTCQEYLRILNRKAICFGKKHKGELVERLRAVVLNKRSRAQLTRLQFPTTKAEWSKLLKDEPGFATKIGELEEKHKRQINGPTAFQKFMETIDETAIAKAKFKFIPVRGPMPVYVWIADRERAIFSIPTMELGKDAHEHGFETTDKTLVSAVLVYRADSGMRAGFVSVRLSFRKSSGLMAC